MRFVPSGKDVVNGHRMKSYGPFWVGTVFGTDIVGPLVCLGDIVGVPVGPIGVVARDGVANGHRIRSYGKFSAGTVFGTNFGIPLVCLGDMVKIPVGPIGVATRVW